MTTYLRVLIATFALLLPSAALADAGEGYITAIMPMPNGAVLFDHSGDRSNIPACQGPGLERRWAFSVAGNEGQAKLSVLLTAYALKKKIRIVGTGACPNWPDTESLLYFLIVD